MLRLPYFLPSTEAFYRRARLASLQAMYSMNLPNTEEVSK
jgi:hypothetical protein